MLFILLGLSLLSSAFGEDVTLQPGKVHEYAMPGYPSVNLGEGGHQIWNFETAPGSKIFTYCTDFRMIPTDKDPCDQFQLIITSGSTVKTYCRNGDIINFKSWGSSLKVEMKYKVGGLVSCVARSTAEFKGEEILVTAAEPTPIIETSRDTLPFTDKIWEVKSPKGEKLSVECWVGTYKDNPCGRQLVIIENGKDKKTEICDTTERTVSSESGLIKIRAIFGPHANMAVSCSAFIQKEQEKEKEPETPPDQEKEQPGQPKPPQTYMINPGEVVEFDNKQELTAEKHSYVISTVTGASVSIACDRFYNTANLDPCEKLNITLDDGLRTTKFCIDETFLRYQSKGSSVKMEINYHGGMWIKCQARTSAVKNKKEISLAVDDGVYHFQHPQIKVPFYDVIWKFTSEEGARVSVQCDISTTSFEDGTVCLYEKVMIDGGDQEKTFCGANKLVQISSGRTLSVRVQLDKQSTGSFFCKAQAVTGSNPNEVDNLKIQESAEDAGLGNGVRTTSCPCGRRNHNHQRIFYGTKTQESEYPWMVGIRNSRSYQRCGGSVITQYHILTAAHCMTDDKKRDRNDLLETVIYVGAHNLYKDASHGKTKGYEVKETHIPEEWFQRKRGYDIAVLVLKEKLEFNKFVSPVCLTDVAAKVTYKSIKALGWGLTEKNEAAPELLSTYLFPLHKTQCGDSNVIICTSNKYSSVCFGDSGGPLVYVDPETNLYTQIGVTSYVNYPYCESNSGYSNVTFHYDYIRDVVKKTNPEAEICLKM